MTFQEKFDELKNTYGKTADFSAVDFDLAAQIRMTDADCHGTFYVACIGGVPAIEPYDYHDNTVDLAIESSLLCAMLDGKTDPVQAFLDGQFELKGNADHALALINALKKKPKKRKTTTAKKSEAGTAAAKKPAARTAGAKTTAKKAAAKKTKTDE